MNDNALVAAVRMNAEQQTRLLMQVDSRLQGLEYPGTVYYNRFEELPRAFKKALQKVMQESLGKALAFVDLPEYL